MALVKIIGQWVPYNLGIRWQSERPRTSQGFKSQSDCVSIHLCDGRAKSLISLYLLLGEFPLRISNFISNGYVKEGRYVPVIFTKDRWWLESYLVCVWRHLLLESLLTPRNGCLGKLEPSSQSRWTLSELKKELDKKKEHDLGHHLEAWITQWEWQNIVSLHCLSNSGENSRSVRTLMRRDSGSIRMMLLLKLLILPEHGSVKNLGSVSSALKLKGIEYLTWSDQISSSWRFLNDSIYQGNPRTIATLKAAIKWSLRKNMHVLTITLHTAFNSAFDWTVGIWSMYS